MSIFDETWDKDLRQIPSNKQECHTEIQYAYQHKKTLKWCAVGIDHDHGSRIHRMNLIDEFNPAITYKSDAILTDTLKRALPSDMKVEDFELIKVHVKYKYIPVR